MNSLRELVQFFREKDHFILVGHEHPDPDSLGSMLGLYFGLRKMGKHCRMVSGDPLPEDLSWSGLELIEYLPQGLTPGNSCLVVLDCEPHRTGALAPGVLQAKCLVNIDHHQRERGQGDLVYVDAKEAATSVIIYRILLELGVKLDQQIAVALYGGIVGDTGGFRFSNTTSELLRIAAELLDNGVKPAPIMREIFFSHSHNYLRFLGYALTKMQVTQGGRLAWVAINLSEFEKFGIEPQTVTKLIGYIRMLNTVEIALEFREIKPKEIRLGFRSDKINVGRLARHLGGGGHKLSSGTSLQGDLEDITNKVVQIAEHYLLTGELSEWHS